MTETINRQEQIRPRTHSADAVRPFMILLLVLVWVLPMASSAAQDESTLLPGRLYYQVDRPIVIGVAHPESSARVLTILKPDNTEVESARVKAGDREVDLAELFPTIFTLHEVHYVQLLIDGQPAGAALTLQPLVTRPTPVLRYSARGSQRVPTVVDWERPPENELIMSGFRIYEEPFLMLHTTMGDITLILRPDEAPNTAWNFIELAEGGFYTTIPFHRVVALAGNGQPFVIQAGDPSGTGAGGCAYDIDLEPSELPHDLGVISMARQGHDVNTGGSQFFLCLSRAGTQFLDGQYTAFGQTVKGIDVIKSIAAVKVDDRDRPIDMPYIEETKLIAAPPRMPGEAPSWLSRPSESGNKQGADSEKPSDGR